MPKKSTEYIVNKIASQEPQMRALFEAFCQDAGKLLKRYKSHNVGGVWYGNKRIEKELNKLIDELHENLVTFTTNEINTAWAASNDTADEIINNYIKGLSVSDIATAGIFDRNITALNAFVKAKQNGLTISDRIWEATAGAKTQIEFFLDSGIAEGRSAAQMTKDIRHLLIEPERQFRRVKDPITGKLVPSNPMKNYHPGQGVYRSSYKNALRVTATETNYAYRYADHLRWKKNDFVLGFEVKLSDQHPDFDICDQCKGIYPKNFFFGGWHPYCFCYAVPILPKREDFLNYLDGKKLSGYVGKIPSDTSAYIRDNKEKLLSMKNKPYWLNDNFKVKGKQIINNF